jgi:hypothetical protein
VPPWRAQRALASLAGAFGVDGKPDTTKVRKAFWLDPRLLEEARASPGAPSERETVEMALDLAAFRNELIQGVRALRRVTLSRID